MERLAIVPSQNIATSHAVPGSKSYTNRALIIAALARGPSTLLGALESDDTIVARRALSSLGIPIEQEGQTIRVHGQAGRFCDPDQTLYLGNSGTSTRFFTAMLTLADFPCTITGNARMQQRPIADLVEALYSLGADVTSIEKNGCPPIHIGPQRLRGGTTAISGAISSQFLSALLMVAPYAQQEVVLEVRDKLVSVPYVDITLDIMARFGVHVHHENYQRFVIAGQQFYQGQEYLIEGDASSATYFWGLAALLGRKMTIRNIPSSSAQADLKFLQVLERMGCEISRHDGLTVNGPNVLKPLGKIDLNDLPDAAMTVAVLAAFCSGKTHICNVGNLRVKETDRLHALATELRKIGVLVEEFPDGISINSDPESLHGADIETYDDHRMAMCFGMAGVRLPGIEIQQPSCVSKTYPEFWQDLKHLGVNLQVI
jgi:3-phosphoshikimate 1-carboxyvinyltransferase